MHQTGIREPFLWNRKVSKETSPGWLWKIAVLTLIHTLLAGNGSVSDTGGRVRDRGTEEATCPWSRCERLEMALCLDSLRSTKENLWESNKQSQSETSRSLAVSLSLAPSRSCSFLPSLSHWTEPNKSMASRITLLCMCTSLRREKQRPSRSPRKSSGHFFNINIPLCRHSNDIRELAEFSTQLDMLIEKAGFKGKVHVSADGGTIQDGRPRSVSFPSHTLMARAGFSLFAWSLT